MTRFSAWQQEVSCRPEPKERPRQECLAKLIVEQLFKLRLPLPPPSPAARTGESPEEEEEEEEEILLPPPQFNIRKPSNNI